MNYTSKYVPAVASSSLGIKNMLGNRNIIIVILFNDFVHYDGIY
jgi:hypothetical protein